MIVLAMKRIWNYIILLILAGILLIVVSAAACRNKTVSSEEKPHAAADTGSLDTGGDCIRIISRKEYEAILEQSRGAVFRASDLFWHKSVTACDEKTASVYLPCDVTRLASEAVSDRNTFVEDLFSGLQPAADDSRILVCSDEWLEDPGGAVSTGHPFEALLQSGENAAEFRIILTGLPAVCLEKTDPETIVRKEEHEGRIRYIPLFSGTEDLIDTYSFCSFHVRGNVSSTLEKKPFKLTLTDKAGNKQKRKLADLREDDDWILNPLFTDSTRVREMTAYGLWDQVSAFSELPQASSRMRYVEVFLDNAYQGIYGLMEPVDGRQLALTEGDLLYKIDRWDREYPYLDEYENNEGKTEIFTDRGFPCVEIRYPTRWDRTASWFPMQVFHTFSFRTKDLNTLSRAGLELDRDSLVSISLYCALTHAMDSTWKNSFLIAKAKEDGGYKLYRTIWDLNFVFGDVFVCAPEDGYTSFDPGTAGSYKPTEDSTYDYEAYLSADPSLDDSLRQKWAVWRKGGINADSVCDAAEQNLSLLKDSGALDREMERWPQQKKSEQAFDEMEEWIRTRFAYLDRRFGWNTK